MDPVATIRDLRDDTAIEQAFLRLVPLLKTTPLPTSDGGKRFADADEFMLMEWPVAADGPRLGFKHSHTRRYVWVQRFEGKDILVTSTPSFFDAPPCL